MANIREASAPGDLGLRPDDRASDALANSGRRIAALYGEAGDAINDTGRRVASAGMDVATVAEKYMEHREISQGAAESSKTLTNLDQQWNDRVKNADPNDPSVAAKFKEEVVDPTLDKLNSSFMTEGGQKYAESTVERFRSHFDEKTAADMSRLAREAVSQNIETLKNQLSNMAISDPTSLKTSLGMVEHSVGAMVDSSPNLKGVDAASIKLQLVGDTQKAIVKAAAIGAINENPEAGLKQFSSPEYSKYISGAELKTLESQANAVKRAARIEENYALQTQKMQKQDVSDDREGKYLQKMTSDDPRERAGFTPKAVAGDFDLTREARERLISMADRATKPETDAKISKQTSVELFNKIRADDNADPVKLKNMVDDQYSAGNLSWGDRTNLMKEVEDRKTPEGLALAQDRAQFFKQYAGAIANQTIGASGKMEVYDPQMGSPKLYAAERDARRVEQDLKSKGLDPHLAYDPSSEYFIGKMVPKWRGSMQGDLTSRAETPAKTDTGVPPNLMGIASLSFSKARNLYRDDTSGKLYRPDGTEVK